MIILENVDNVWHSLVENWFAFYLFFYLQYNIIVLQSTIVHFCNSGFELPVEFISLQYQTLRDFWYTLDFEPWTVGSFHHLSTFLTSPNIICITRSVTPDLLIKVFYIPTSQLVSTISGSGGFIIMLTNDFKFQNKQELAWYNAYIVQTCTFCSKYCLSTLKKLQDLYFTPFTYDSIHSTTSFLSDLE
jgi:hypothetical protein